MHVYAGSILLTVLYWITTVVANPVADTRKELVAKRAEEIPKSEKRWEWRRPAPKFVIISLFPPEAEQVLG